MNQNVQDQGVDPLLPDFRDSATAFRHLSNRQLLFAHILFTSMTFRPLAIWGPRLLAWSLRIGLPVRPVIKRTLFKQFCGGETLDECMAVITDLRNMNVGTILDYAVEGGVSASECDAAEQEISSTIDLASRTPSLRYAVFKCSGLIRPEILEKVTSKFKLSEKEQEEWNLGQTRIHRLCQTAASKNVRIFIDAEESWLQGAIDNLAESMMKAFNQQRPIVYNTLQMYRHDRLTYLEYLDKFASQHGIQVGIKLVRGAYHEKEIAWAESKGIRRPAVHRHKADTDKVYNGALDYIIARPNQLHLCAATHNEVSCLHLARALLERGHSPKSPQFEFSQLFGMGNHISFALSGKGFLVSKYLPYGPLPRVMPYLFRRAEENTSVRGQTNRELALIRAERQRRLLAGKVPREKAAAH